ncbi:MAG: PqqD family protein [Acidobacteria bacterium]|nr:PqqD family protein [Acidobacteriota bacterium]
MLSFATESYYYLNGPASAAWKLLAQPYSLSEICVALCEEYDVDRDMQQLLDDPTGLRCRVLRGGVYQRKIDS